MGKYIKYFQNHNDYETYIDSSTRILPNLSYCKNLDDIHFNHLDEVIITIDVTSTAEFTQIGVKSTGDFLNVDTYDNVSNIILISPTNNKIKLKKEDLLLEQGASDSDLGIEYIYKYKFDEIGIWTVRLELIDHTKITQLSYFLMTNLIDVILPKSIRTLELGSFGFSSIQSITLPNKLNNIMQSSFMGCTELTSITIPKNVTEIEDNTFNGAVNLARIDLPNTITSIGDQAFSNCSSLTTITIPNSVTTIGDHVFEYCSSLTNITIPNSVAEIGSYAFNNCGLISVIFNGNCDIPDNCFANNSSLTTVVIGDQVIFINSNSFNSCSNLQNLTIGNNVIEIGTDAFSYCSSLINVTLPSSIEQICAGAFSGCSSLVSVTILATTPPLVENECFLENAEGRKFYVPAASVDAYKAANIWSTYAADIEAIS